VPRAERSIFVAGLACNFCIGWEVWIVDV
jgi:hypothetical protein